MDPSWVSVTVAIGATAVTTLSALVTGYVGLTLRATVAEMRVMVAEMRAAIERDRVNDREALREYTDQRLDRIADEIRSLPCRASDVCPGNSQA